MQHDKFSMLKKKAQQGAVLVEYSLLLIVFAVTILFFTNFLQFLLQTFDQHLAGCSRVSYPKSLTTDGGSC